MHTICFSRAFSCISTTLNSACHAYCTRWHYIEKLPISFRYSTQNIILVKLNEFHHSSLIRWIPRKNTNVYDGCIDKFFLFLRSHLFQEKKKTCVTCSCCTFSFTLFWVVPWKIEHLFEVAWSGHMTSQVLLGFPQLNKIEQ